MSCSLVALQTTKIIIIMPFSSLAFNKRKNENPNYIERTRKTIWWLMKMCLKPCRPKSFSNAMSRTMAEFYVAVQPLFSIV